ncbi:transposase [Pseudorhodoplanes sp.]|uniref:transposase n=1 Tax=Pseudorhodoplanes sp. TaxID=1934341 RepID=UPI003D0DC6E0
MTTEPASRPIFPPARDGRRRAFNEEDKRRIVEEATQPGASLSAVARHYGIAVRVVFRWKQELANAAEPTFIAVHITWNTSTSDRMVGSSSIRGRIT